MTREQQIKAVMDAFHEADEAGLPLEKCMPIRLTPNQTRD